jgi:NadR type nicotinamide-nucleotide adenylyltransferase
MRRGLTLGKYAPFHQGHQMVIETALAEVDELIVMIYDSDLIEVPLPVRAGWIKSLYPAVTVIEAWDGPDGYGDTPEIMHVQESYILKKLNGLPITHFYSSEFYGDHVSRALNAVDRRVDEPRRMVPISGTQLRADYYSGREYLSDTVYTDLIVKACFLGAPSTGKTTLASALAEQYDTQWMPEYGGEYWLQNHVGRRITLEQFEEIAPEHNRREDALVALSRRYLFCDTSPITTYMFAKDYHGCAGPVLTKLAREAEKRYDLFFLCDTDIPYADTWDRSGDQKRQWFQRQIVGDLAERRTPYFVLQGDLESRIGQVGNVLKQFRKFGNIANICHLRTPEDRVPCQSQSGTRKGSPYRICDL